MGIKVNLTPQLEEFVRAKVASGMYASTSEVVCEALRLMDKQDRLRQARLDELRREVHMGLDSGVSAPWNAAAVKATARARRATKSTVA